MTFNDVVESSGILLESVGVAIILAGTVVVLFRHGVHVFRDVGSSGDRYMTTRRGIARALLLGLEVLVAGDVIRTVAIEPTLAAVASLGLVVLIRTFLSFSIEVETEGRWPWQRTATEE